MILQTIQSESEAFYARNFAVWQAKFSANPSWTCVEENGFVLQAYSKKDLDKLVGDYMKANPTADNVSIERQNILFIADVNSVWVNFDEHQTSNGKTKVLKGVRLMTKVGNKWVISALHSSFVKYKQ